MRVALARKLDEIDGVELSELPDPEPTAGQALIRVHGAGVGVCRAVRPGQEIAGVVGAAGEGAGAPRSRRCCR
jgi:NADPH:quinone reductase-like Zn-dependent oxidoreductase